MEINFLCIYFGNFDLFSVLLSTLELYHMADEITDLVHDNA